MRLRGRRRVIYIASMVGIALLYLISVPWYRDVNEPLQLWLGLPDWVAVAILCYVAVAVLNGVAWSVVDIPDDPDEPEARQ